MSEKSLPMRSVKEAAPSLVGERGASGSQSAFQVTCLSGLRHDPTWILPEEPVPATAAVGTSWHGRVVIRRLVESLIDEFRQLAQRVREAGDLERLRGIGRRRQRPSVVWHSRLRSWSRNGSVRWV